MPVSRQRITRSLVARDMGVRARRAPPTARAGTLARGGVVSTACAVTAATWAAALIPLDHSGGPPGCARATVASAAAAAASTAQAIATGARWVGTGAHCRCPADGPVGAIAESAAAAAGGTDAANTGPAGREAADSGTVARRADVAAVAINTPTGFTGDRACAEALPGSLSGAPAGARPLRAPGDAKGTAASRAISSGAGALPAAPRGAAAARVPTVACAVSLSEPISGMAATGVRASRPARERAGAAAGGGGWVITPAPASRAPAPDRSAQPPIPRVAVSRSPGSVLRPGPGAVRRRDPRPPPPPRPRPRAISAAIRAKPKGC